MFYSRLSFFLNCSLIYTVLFFYFFHSGSFQWTQELLILHKVHYQPGQPVFGQWFKWQSHVHLEGTVWNYEIEICFMFAILSRYCVFLKFKSNFTSQISDPTHPPMMLQGHSEEVTSVAWCPTDFTKVRQPTFNILCLKFQSIAAAAMVIFSILFFICKTCWGILRSTAGKLSCFDMLKYWIRLCIILPALLADCFLFWWPHCPDMEASSWNGWSPVFSRTGQPGGLGTGQVSHK